MAPPEAPPIAYQRDDRGSRASEARVSLGDLGDLGRPSVGVNGRRRAHRCRCRMDRSANPSRLRSRRVENPLARDHTRLDQTEAAHRADHHQRATADEHLTPSDRHRPTLTPRTIEFSGRDLTNDQGRSAGR